MHDSTEEIRSKSIFEDVDIDGFILCKCCYHAPPALFALLSRRIASASALT
jgi:hypothetical protein